jgi:predicted dehydrogenase
MTRSATSPRLAFVGLGWIGCHRLQSVVDANVVDVVALADSDPNALERAASIVPAAVRTRGFDEALALHPDGIVLATPNALHAAQSIRALEQGVAVFCQKPLGRDAAEVYGVIDTARRQNRLLGVDFSYRHTRALSRIRDLVREGTIGEVYAMDLTFHNAFGPDKPWFYDVKQSGGGCLLDLGVHLIDFLYWTFQTPTARVNGHLFSGGKRLGSDGSLVEDYATGEIEFVGGAVARIACSWKLSAGCDAQIGVYLYGTSGALGFRNLEGSFYDFVAECYRGTERHVIASPPDDWGGRATVAWCQQLARSAAYDPEIALVGRVASTIDQLYGRSTPRSDGSELGSEIDRENAAELRSYSNR